MPRLSVPRMSGRMAGRVGGGREADPRKRRRSPDLQCQQIRAALGAGTPVLAPSVDVNEGKTMQVAIHDADGGTYPNLALMKLVAWHRKNGDEVFKYQSIFALQTDRVYSSKVFTFTPCTGVIGKEERGGTGYGLNTTLPDEIEHIMPAYDFYGCDKSYGFLTRGCPNSCGWCIVPKKEGAIRAHADVEEFLAHKDVVLMDNNVLAHDHGLAQIEKMARLGVKVDFNQGLDARRIDDGVARRLAKLKWLAPVRLACDQKGQMESIQKAVTLLRWHNVTPRRYFVYVLVKDVDDALERVRFLKGLDLDPFAQPYRDFASNTEPTQEQKDFSRWVNHKAIFKTVPWEDYKGRAT